MATELVLRDPVPGYERLLETWLAGLRQKREMIRRQRGIADHLAAYAPAGAGTPWFTIGPRHVNGRVKALAVHPTNADINHRSRARRLGCGRSPPNTS
jgi:hypothetical protein